MPYFNKTRGALGATYDPFKGGQASDFGWKQEGKNFVCVNMRTGAPYTGGLATFPCGERPSASGGGAVWDFFKKSFLPQTGPSYQGGPGGAPTTTASSLLLPAVVVVGAVGVLLILKKKK